MDIDYFQQPVYHDTSLSTAGIVAVIALFIAIAASLILYFTFMNKKNIGHYSGFSEKLYNFLHFRTMWLENMLKFFYVFTAIFITVFSFDSLFNDYYLGFFIMLIGGNIACRLAYELLMLFVRLCTDVSAMRGQRQGGEEAPSTSAIEEEPIATSGYRSPNPFANRGTHAPSTHYPASAEEWGDEKTPEQVAFPAVDDDEDIIPAPSAEQEFDAAEIFRPAQHEQTTSSTRYCINCGVALSATAEFCPACGYKNH